VSTCLNYTTHLEKRGAAALIPSPKRRRVFPRRFYNEIEKDKEVVYEEEFRFWRTTLGSVVARHLPPMTVSQMKELIKKIKEGAVEIKFIDYQK